MQKRGSRDGQAYRARETNRKRKLAESYQNRYKAGKVLLRLESRQYGREATLAELLS